MLDVALLIDGAPAAAAGEATFDRIDPISRQVATRAAAASVDDAVHAANIAARSFAEWSNTSPSERRACLNRAADRLLERMDDFAETVIAETGGTKGWSDFNCRLAASILREAAAMTTQIAGEVIPADRADTFAMADAPALRRGASALRRGTRRSCWQRAPSPCRWPAAIRSCCKASELCPRTHGLLGEVLSGAGMPAGTVNVIHTSPGTAPEIVEALIAHPAVRRINFTGSTRVGRIVAEKAARHLKRCVLGLSGKAPMIVLEDADLDQAVDAAVFGAFFHQGQICMSTERIIVPDTIADEFVADLPYAPVRSGQAIRAVPIACSAR